jgi:hypothetical protein
MRRRAGSIFLLGLVVSALILPICPLEAQAADPVPERSLNVTVHNGKLLVTSDFTDVFSRKIQSKLSSGLPTRVVLQLELMNRAGKAVAAWARSTEIVYDLWEEHYQVTVEDDQGRRRATMGKVGEVMATAGRLLRDPVAYVIDLPPGEYGLRMAVEVNPVSQGMVKNIRRWLARPAAGKAGGGSQTNLFGSFVGTFVDRHIGEADHSVEFVSQWFRLGHP